jgi:hypothetical protein
LEFVARIVLKNRIVILGYRSNNGFISTAMENIQFSFTEANLLPDNHIVNQEYNALLDKFEKREI